MEKYLHLIFLNKCYFCDVVGDVICFRCIEKFICFNNTSTNSFSFFEYNDIAKKLLYLSKYPPYYFYLLKFLVLFAIKNFPRFQSDFFKNSILCPVPLSKLKLFERGFNQAEIICEVIETELGIPYLNLLKRVKDTKPLFELSKEQRYFELQKAFKPTLTINFLKIFKYDEIVLVDDLITTSTTLNYCRKVLEQKGIKRVKFLSLFRKRY